MIHGVRSMEATSQLGLCWWAKCQSPAAAQPFVAEVRGAKAEARIDKE
jgi:hypothetical protein